MYISQLKIWAPQQQHSDVGIDSGGKREQRSDEIQTLRGINALPPLCVAVDTFHAKTQRNTELRCEIEHKTWRSHSRAYASCMTRSHESAEEVDTYSSKLSFLSGLCNDSNSLAQDHIPAPAPSCLLTLTHTCTCTPANPYWHSHSCSNSCSHSCSHSLTLTLTLIYTLILTVIHTHTQVH